MIEIIRLDKIAGDVLKPVAKLVDSIWPEQSRLLCQTIDLHARAPKFFEAFYTAAKKPDQNEFFGFCMTTSSDLSTELRTMSWLVVAKQEQKKGIGADLVKACVDDTRQRGKELVLATPSPDFFTRQGFRIISKYSPYDRHIMQIK